VTLVRTRPGRWALARRLCETAAVLVVAAARLAVRLAARPVPGRARRETVPELLASVLTRAVEDLGPAFVKLAQILGTRADLLPGPVCVALRRLYDRVRPPPAGKAIRVVPATLLAAVEGGPAGLVLVAAGSIACVYRARLRTGELVAVKVRRPGVARTLATDLALCQRAARFAARLPRLRGVPLVEVIDQVADAIYQQVDLVREREDLATLRRDLAAVPAVRVPAVLETWSGPDILVQEYVPGLLPPEAGAGPGSRQGETRLRHHPAPLPARRAGALAAMRACFHMLFLTGFVHCDMHPGNVYVRPDGTCVLLDAGFARRLTPYARRRFADFFYGMSRGDGGRCAEIVLGTATRSRPDADEAGFRRDLAALVERHSRLAVADFDLIGFAVRLFDVQRSHGFVADPQFAFPILALLVLEGSLRRSCPDVDFQKEALPFVLRGLMT
jgi:ubiquinone biosynthesis protein